MASTFFSLAFRWLGTLRPPLVLVWACAAFGTLLGAVTGAIAAVRLTKIGYVRYRMLWISVGLAAAGFFVTGLMQRQGAFSLFALSVLGAFCGLVVAVVGSAFLPSRVQEPSSSLNTAASAAPYRRRLLGRILAGFFAASLLIACLIYQAIDSQRAVERGFLGVTFQSDFDSAGPEPGVVVTGVARGSSAEANGIRVGDRIVALDDEIVETAGDLYEAMRYRRAGESLTVTLVTDEQRRTIDIELMDVYAIDQADFDQTAPVADQP